MKYRKMRIAWSAVWGILCLLLLVLWVRSYWWWDSIGVKFSANRAVAAHSFTGEVMVLISNDPTGKWGFQQTSIKEAKKRLPGLGLPVSRGDFDYITDGFSIKAFVPFWALAPVPAILTALPWIAWRFSLRTLLIAMTLVAVMLGLVVWAA